MFEGVLVCFGFLLYAVIFVNRFMFANFVVHFSSWSVIMSKYKFSLEKETPFDVPHKSVSSQGWNRVPVLARGMRIFSLTLPTPTTTGGGRGFALPETIEKPIKAIWAQANFEHQSLANSPRTSKGRSAGVAWLLTSALKQWLEHR